jgi:hypothetical protein
MNREHSVSSRAGHGISGGGEGPSVSGDTNETTANQCGQFGPALTKTVSVAIRLLGWSATNGHGLVERVLEDVAIQNKLAEEFRKAGEELMKQQMGDKPLTLGASLGKFGSSARKVLEKPVVSSFKKSAAFKKLEKSLEETKCAFDDTPVGAFVNDNKTWLLVTGVVAVVGGGFAMYRAKAGDVPAKAFAILPFLAHRKIGAVDLSLKTFTLEPSTQTVGADLAITGEWTNVKAEFEIGAKFADEKLLSAAGKGKLVLTLSPRWEVSGAAAYSWSRDSLDDRRAVKASAEIGVKRKLSDDADVTFQLFGNYTDDDKALSRQVGIKANLTVKDVIQKGTKLTLGPSYDVKVTQGHHALGYDLPRTNETFFLNLRLEFGHEEKKKRK